MRTRQNFLPFFIVPLFTLLFLPISFAKESEDSDVLAAAKTLDQLAEEYGFKPEPAPGGVEKNKGTTMGLVRMWGHYRLAAGDNGDDFILNDSNADFQERNFRYLFGEALNNTYDKAIYSQYLLNIDFKPAARWDFYTQIVADPWSWVGTKGDHTTRSDVGGEELRYNLKYFGANNSVLNEIWRTNTGDSVAFPIIKVKDGHITRTTVHGFYDFSPSTGGAPFTIPELDIDYEFRPFRKMWLDYTEDDWHARFFALADQSQALTTDDPLRLSNHRDYWQQSPWLDQYRPIQYFSDGSFKRGHYSDSLAFLARDSEGNRLVLLRGASFEGDFDSTYLAATVAAPYTPWDENYFAADSVPGAIRAKHQATDRLMVGATYTFRTGLIKDSVADLNQVAGIDTKYKINENVSFRDEVAISFRDRDMLTSERAKADSGGYAARAALEGSFDRPDKGHTDFELAFTQMDRAFDPGLSRYTNTRDDHFWGKHLTFEDVSPELEFFRLGDGIDINRQVYRARWKEKLFKDRFVHLFDMRHVRKADDLSLHENVLREELTWKATSKLTAKGLFRWQLLPESYGGVEPFLSNYYFYGDPAAVAVLSLQNADVPGGKDPSRFTYAGALQYAWNPRVTVEGFYELTNDVSDFPRGLLNSAFRDSSDRVDGLLVDRIVTLLYGQGHFGGIPPYEYNSIFRERLRYKLDSRTLLTLHAAQNGYKHASGIDDNINHQGISAEYHYSKKLSFFGDFTHSMQIDAPKLISTNYTEHDYEDHYNFYTSMDYRLNSTTVFRAEYGVFGMGSNAPQVNPYSTTSFSLPTIDTEHLLRVSLNGDF